jgi:hypothetical protein
VDRRGAGPLDASIFGRGAGEGFGVHICTGPISVKDAEPGDVIEVRIDDMTPRPSRSPGYEGRCFGSNVAAWWGYHYGELIEEPKPRENVTIYEIFADGDEGYAQALYAYRWSPQVDPFGVPSPNLRLSRRSSRQGHSRDLRRFSERRPDSAASTLRRHGACAARSRPGRFRSAGLFRRQSRQLAPRQRFRRIPARLSARRPFIDRRSARRAGGWRSRRDRHRMLDDRAFHNCPTQEGGPLRWTYLSVDRNAHGVGCLLVSAVTQVVDGNWGVHAIVRKSLFRV